MYGVFGLALFAIGFFMGMSYLKDNIFSYAERFADMQGNVITTKIDVEARLIDGQWIRLPKGTRATITSVKDGKAIFFAVIVNETER